MKTPNPSCTDSEDMSMAAFLRRKEAGAENMVVEVALKSFIRQWRLDSSNFSLKKRCPASQG